MKSARTLVCLVLAFSLDAHAFRDDIPLDPQLDCVKAGPGPAYRQECALAAIARACATDGRPPIEEIAKALGVTGVQVNKALGRHTLASLDRGDLCARGEKERRQVLNASLAPKKVATESAMEWTHLQLGGFDGRINHAGVAQALAQREEMLSQEKRAGLPTAPALGWTNITGYTQSAGRINHILFTSGTGNDILAAADGGGIWRTTNGGNSWTAVNDFLGSLAIANFAKAGNDALTIYAGTNPHGSHTYFPFGVMKSTDGGVTWSQLPSTNPSTNADFAYVQRIAVHPTNSSIVLAATDHGAYQTIDGGANWTKVGGIATLAYFVAFHPTNGNLRAVAYNDGTVRHTTTGDLLGAGAATATVLGAGTYMKIAYAASDVNRMYALVTDGTTSNTRMFMSTTGGSSWSEIINIPDSSIFFNTGYLRYTGGLWVDPFNANRVAVFEGWAAFTPDITTVTPATWKRLYSGWVDFHGIVEHPGYNGGANKQVFFMDDGGLYSVSDIDKLDMDGLLVTDGHFTRLDAGMAVTEVYSVAGYRGNMILGAQDVAPKVYKASSSDSTILWRFVGRPSVGCPTCSWIGDGATAAGSTANPAVLYGSRQYLDMIRSTDSGATAVSIVSGSALTDGSGATASNFNAAFIAPFVLDPSNQSRMLAGGVSLWRSNNVDTGNPPTWTAIRAPFTDANCGTYQPPVQAIAIAPSNPDVVWVGYQCSGRMFKSVNATQASPTWTEVTTAPGALQFRFQGAIMIDRYDPNIVWVGVTSYQASTLFKTTDGGATPGAWTTIAGLPGAPVSSLAQHPANTNWIYAATNVGLFSSNDGGFTWAGSNEGPANVVVKSLSWHTTGPVSELLVGTYGRGVWKAMVATPRTDFSADNRSDLLYRNTSTGQVYRILMNGLAVSSGAMAYTEPNTAWKVISDGDFNGDGVTDLLWRNSTDGRVFQQPFAANGMPNGGAIFYTEPNAAWKIVFTPDLDGDGKADLLWYNTSTGQVYVMLMNGATIKAQAMVYAEPNLAWSIAAVGDFAGTGRTSQLLWRNSSTGQIYLQTLAFSPGFSQSGTMIYQEPNTAWRVIGAPDLDGDGRSDILWRNDATGQVYGMLMNGATIASQAMIYTEPNLAWKIVAQADYNGDGKADLIYRNDTTGQVYMILMNGLVTGAAGMVYSEPNTAWRLLGPWEYAQ